MPSVGELRFVYIHQEVIVFGVFDVVPLVVHTDYHHIMPSLVPIFIGDWIINWPEDLYQDYHRKPILDEALHLFYTHVFLLVEVQRVLKVDLFTFDQLVKTILKHIRTSSLIPLSSRCCHDFRFVEIDVKVVQHCL